VVHGHDHRTPGFAVNDAFESDGFSGHVKSSPEGLMAAGVMVMQRGASAAPLRPRRSVGEYALHSISLSAGVNAEVCIAGRSG
jgi:hypothetical protein